MTTVTRAPTRNARAITTALLAEGSESGLYEEIRPLLPSGWTLLEEAAHLAYLTAGAVLAMSGRDHGRAEIARAWYHARPEIGEELNERFGPETDLRSALAWADVVLGNAGGWYVPAHDPGQHLAVMLAITMLIWGAERPDADWRRVCLALTDGEAA